LDNYPIIGNFENDEAALLRSPTFAALSHIPNGWKNPQAG